MYNGLWSSIWTLQIIHKRLKPNAEPSKTGLERMLLFKKAQKTQQNMCEIILNLAYHMFHIELLEIAFGNTHGSLNVPIFHITQPLGISGLSIMATIFGDVQDSQVMGQWHQPLGWLVGGVPFKYWMTWLLEEYPLINKPWCIKIRGWH